MSKDHIYTCEKCGQLSASKVDSVIFRGGFRAVLTQFECDNPECRWIEMTDLDAKPLKEYNLSITELASEIVQGVYGQGEDWREAIKPLNVDMSLLYLEINRILGFEVF